MLKIGLSELNCNIYFEKNAEYFASFVSTPNLIYEENYNFNNIVLSFDFLRKKRAQFF
jgi:hypothetical protein